MRLLEDAELKEEKDFVHKCINSLKNFKDFNQVNLHGKRFYSPYFIIVVYNDMSFFYHSDKVNLTLGIKVTRKAGSAVIRNKIKRRCRHLIRIFYNHYKSNLVNKNLKIILIPRHPFLNTKFELLSEAILSDKFLLRSNDKSTK